MLHKTSLSAPAQVGLTCGCRTPARACSWVVEPAKRNSANKAQWTGLADLRLARLLPCPSASLARSDSALFRHPGEPNLKLREYMVVLEKPVGLTLAPDPKTGQVVVQDIKPNSPAHKCGLIQVGDVVKSCSAVFGDDMWPAADIRRVRWAINSRLGDVKLLLERAPRRPGGGLTAWYCGGKPGVATRERDGMQLPYSFNGSAVPDDLGTFIELPGAGRSLQITFHRNTVTQPPLNRRTGAAAAARAAALQRLRRELCEARNMPRVELAPSLAQRPAETDVFAPPPAVHESNDGTRARGGGGGGGAGPVVDVAAPLPPTSASSATGAPAGNGASNGSNNGNGSNGSGGGGGGGGLPSGLKPNSTGSGSGAAAAAGAAATAAAPGRVTDSSGGSGAKEKKVVLFLPWLLVTCGRLEHRDMAAIASNRSLGAILELSLTRAQPQQQQQQQPQVSSSSSSQSGSAPSGGDGGSAAATEVSNGSSNSSSSTGGNGGSSSSSRSVGGGGGGGGGSGGGYLVVRGTDLAPLASDVGRVSYQTLLAAATAAANPGGGSGGSGSSGGTGGGSSPPPLPPPIPIGEEPLPPPPGSAAATAAMINGADVIAADGSSLVTTSLNNGPGGSSGGGGGSTSDAGGSSSSSGGGGGGGGDLGSSTMAFLNRSIFLNLRSSLPFAMNPLAASTSTPSASSAQSSFSSSSSATTATATTAAAAGGAARPLAFSALPTSRYDPLRVRHLLNAAASLQRLVFRRGGRLHRARRDACAVLLHCDEGMDADVAVLLAGWLHWFRRMPLQEAILAAETAMGATVDQGLLEAGTSALLQGARERCSRVVLTWKYGGLSAFVAGDVVASWAARVPMVRCRSPLGCKGDTHLGHFFLDVRGLRPGVYYYKYIVDGTWAIDSCSNKVLDAAGNWNNVLVVPEPPLVLTSREGMALARWQAARLALESKMGLVGPGGGAVQRPM